MSIRGYKVFNHDWTCRGFKYEVGKIYKHEGDISLCNKGFHFCRKIADCFSYYDFNPKNKVAEVEAIGLVESDEYKSVTNEIKILREISWEEMLKLANEGYNNTGIRNTGNCNTGNWNTGNRNTGNRNTGNWNTGNCNTGNCNTGDCNTGDCNTGDWNTGDWNTGDWNTGFFNTKDSTIRLFNKNTKYKYETIIECKGVRVLRWNYENNWWIYSQNMTEEEKKEHPEHETLGGYLKVIPYKDACRLMWDKLDDDEKQAIKEIPYFDADVFKEITGIDVRE